MPYIVKVHECSPPNTSEELRTIGVGSDWLCDQCGEIWELTKTPLAPKLWFRTSYAHTGLATYPMNDEDAKSSIVW